LVKVSFVSIRKLTQLMARHHHGLSSDTVDESRYARGLGHPFAIIQAFWLGTWTRIVIYKRRKGLDRELFLSYLAID